MTYYDQSHHSQLRHSRGAQPVVVLVVVVVQPVPPEPVGVPPGVAQLRAVLALLQQARALGPAVLPLAEPLQVLVPLQALGPVPPQAQPPEQTLAAQLSQHFHRLIRP